MADVPVQQNRCACKLCPDNCHHSASIRMNKYGFDFTGIVEFPFPGLIEAKYKYHCCEACEKRFNRIMKDWKEMEQRCKQQEEARANYWQKRAKGCPKDNKWFEQAALEVTENGISGECNL